MGALLLIIGLLAAGSATQASSLPKVRGLNPELAQHYAGTSGKFTCLDGSKAIPFSQVNDDYCDCADGSDEPGGFPALLPSRASRP